VTMNSMTTNVDEAVLLVFQSPQVGIALSELLDGARLTVLHSQDCSQAFARLARSGISVVICEAALTDGDWKDVLKYMVQTGSPSALIVTSRIADKSLWVEVLNLGGYDVLAQPFDREEVTRVVTSAVRASSREPWRRRA